MQSSDKSNTLAVFKTCVDKGLQLAQWLVHNIYTMLAAIKVGCWNAKVLSKDEGAHIADSVGLKLQFAENLR